CVRRLCACSLFSPLRRPPPPTLFPYTTLFRSAARVPGGGREMLGKHRQLQIPVAAIAAYSVQEQHQRTRSLDRNRDARNTRQSRSEEHTSELQSRENLVCRLLLEKKKLSTDKR